jgi:hypothetical protein
MTIIYTFDDDGAFIAGDTATGRTCYAYPTSTHATKAKKIPQRVAREMMRSENRLGAWRDSPEYFERDYRWLSYAGGGYWHKA